MRTNEGVQVSLQVSDRCLSTRQKCFEFKGLSSDSRERPREVVEMFQRLTLAELSRRMVLKEGNPRLSCESDQTEVADAKPFRAPPGLPDPLAEGKT